jgi:hypothetical protein
MIALKKQYYAMAILSIATGFVSLACDFWRRSIWDEKVATLDELGGHAFADMTLSFLTIVISLIGIILASIGLYEKARLPGYVGLAINLLIFIVVALHLFS